MRGPLPHSLTSTRLSQRPPPRLAIRGTAGDALFLACSRGLALDDGEDVAAPQDEMLAAIDLELRTRVLRVQHLIAGLDVQRDALCPVFVPVARTDGHHFASLGLLFRGIG